jgi:hypothetical protein
MKWSPFLIVLMASCLDLGQVPSPGAGSQPQQSPAQQGLEGRLSQRARALYGPESARTLTFTNRASVPETAGPNAQKTKPTEESPFSSSDYEESTKEMSRKGDIGSGVILAEEKDVLYLDLTPCHADTTIFTFHSPFVKKHLGTLNCNGKRIDKFLVAQR